MARRSGVRKAIVFYSIAAFIVIAIITSPCFSQCDFNWKPGQGLPEFYGYLTVPITWDPDGDGPQPERLVVVYSDPVLYTYCRFY